MLRKVQHYVSWVEIDASLAQELLLNPSTGGDKANQGFSGVLISTLPFLIHEYGGNILLITIIFFRTSQYIVSTITL